MEAFIFLGILGAVHFFCFFLDSIFKVSEKKTTKMQKCNKNIEISRVVCIIHTWSF